ncbi:MAG: ABC transporter ATP-binding protein [Natronomonas sp.]|jgi:branched-chain amino acid transport system ATP-binding protein|uniref:ABC transporter ATP-binding protein n=1 Tax=Natronomonas salsuginis TaxID=2217661 RepID=A0A4U5JCI8_9EURY|nr:MULTISPECIES: ABC transporter ATP-binding protein [Natronomonas]MDR9380384.1 ABC transporter ATP-binding protein [Natronomonas sp.]MDR9430182.1 ABC transporter ATP-binding protein [Natronomonas sp.]TKR26011.1 ABC transporter ATP-binding protein [Natronomonas salsuginis]
MSTQDTPKTGGGAGIRGGPYVSPDDAVLGCRNVTKTFGAITACDDISIGIDEGEWVSIVGPNGAGKTTLLNVLNGFYDPDPGGEIFFEAEDVTADRAFKRARKGLGRTFQGLELFEEEDVLENVMTVQAVKERPNLLSALAFYGTGRKVEAQNMRRVEEIIDYLELWEYRHSTVSSLPLGIQRRVDLARTLALDPDVLLLDEAMSGLTFDEKYDMVRFLADLNEEEGLTLVMIEHDLEVVTDVSERMIVLHKGGVIARGPPDDVTSDPEVRNIYTGVD